MLMERLRATLFNRPLNKRSVAVLGIGLISVLGLHAQTFSVLHSFNGPDGANPQGAVVQAPNGKLYGTAPSGVTGTVFAITTNGALTVEHTFCVPNQSCQDGLGPWAGLARAPNGDFYGTTIAGGPYELGTVFKIDPSGALTTLYTFSYQLGDGAQPIARLSLGFDGNFYGTTSGGGNISGHSATGYGTIFKITPGGTLTTIYTFCPDDSPCLDGYNPRAGLIQAGNGNFYGTTPFGGNQGSGTIFEITPTGAFTVLHSFCSQPQCQDGGGSNAALVQANNGDFYGTNYGGGAMCSFFVGGCGTVFKMTSAGKFTTLHRFCSENGCPDGANPDAELIQGTDGNFYGTTYYGGAPCAIAGGCGTIFEITPKGELTTLHSFCAVGLCSDGTYPQAGLVQDTNGTFYGTTLQGGTDPSNDGTVFSFSVGLGAFVEPDPGFGQVGGIVRILGTNLSRVSSVRFNGISAPFKVVSTSEITVKVPTGASSGRLQVVTPAGTLTSNVPFRVLP